MRRRVPAIHRDDVFPLAEGANKATLSIAERNKLRGALESLTVPHDDIGTLAHFALNGLLLSLGNGLLEEATLAAIETLKTELGYHSSPMIERLLIENICVAWVVHDKTLLAYLANIGGGRSFKQAAHAERCLTSAQRRYLRAIETLGRVRKMKLPPVQINIGGVQAINTTNNVTNSME